METIYPKTRRVDAVEDVQRKSLPDPYRWLEQETDEVRIWQRHQAALASAHVREWSGFEAVRKLVSRFNVEQKHGDQYTIVPRYAAGMWFRTEVVDGASQARVICSEAPMAEGKILYDPSEDDAARPPFVSWISPSPDGLTLALGICRDGSENNQILLIDTTTARILANPPVQKLMDSWTGGAQWLPDSSGFFFSAVGDASDRFEQQVYLHRRTEPSTTEKVDIGWTTTKDYRWVVVSRDGRHAVAFERLVDPIPVAIATLGQSLLHFRPFVTRLRGKLHGHVLGDRFVAATDIGAARGRVVAIPLAARDPNDPAGWQELVPESEAAIQTITPVADFLYISELVETYARVRIVDANGAPAGEVPLPDRGALGIGWWYAMHSTLPRGHPDQFLFTFSSFKASPGIYAHRPGVAELTTLEAPAVRLDNVVVEDHFATSADGAQIPFHIVRGADSDIFDPQPTLIYCYGGFNYPLVAQFPGPMAAFIAAGGTYVHAHLRGGGEFGADWAASGRGRNKQNSYDDLYAVAETLIANGRATRETLAVTGRSLGGLTAGVAATQRPDLWAVVVPRVPILDPIGAAREPTYGRMAMAMELADLDDPAELEQLAQISPYHLIKPGTRYPAIFIDAGGTDPRCAPWHARKFAARLQETSQGTAPILVHIWENVGHGLASDRNIAVIEHSEWIAFTLRHLGVPATAVEDKVRP